MSDDKPCCWECKYCGNEPKKILCFELNRYVCTNSNVVEAHRDYGVNRDIREVKIKKKDLWDSACNYFENKKTLNDVGFHKT